MSVRYVCCEERRRAELAASSTGISGIDYLEVRQGDPVTVPTEIDVVLVRPLPLPGAELTGANIRISGGVRFAAPQVDPVVEALPGPGSVSTYRIRLLPGQQTDFSTYRLSIVGGTGGDQPPGFLDPRLSSVDFSFKVDCGSELDCAAPAPPKAEEGDDPAFDYTARDWEGFRRLMLDRLAVLVPGFTGDEPVDLTTTVVEMLAYRADQQSYRLDWIGTEAFLDTARSRTSLVRHARLVDYRPAEGASARTFVSLAFEAGPGLSFPDGDTLPAGTPVLPRQPGLAAVVTAPEYAGWLRSTSELPVVFETLSPVELWTWRSEIELYTWGDEECCLPRGATSVTLVDRSGGAGALEPGDLLLLAEVAAPDTGEAADADLRHRHVVRLTAVSPTHDVALGLAQDLVDVTWADADALPFDLVVTRRVQPPSGPPQRVVCAQAQGNVVLAEHGASLPPPPFLGLPPTEVASLAPGLDPASPEPGRRWRPRVLAAGPLARTARHLPTDRPARPATELVSVTADDCLPALVLRDAFSSWSARPDLLATGPYGREFVCETDPTGATRLRFGDDLHGVAPSARSTLDVQGRFGFAPDGNVGAEALGHVVVPETDAERRILRPTNPLPAGGGAAPETAAAVRAAAPEAFRVPRRAVTPHDYAWAALQLAEVANAVATTRWTGSWHTVVVHVDRVGGAPVDPEFRAALLDHLETYRLAGVDVAVRGARPAPLDVELEVCVRDDAIRSVVAPRVRAALAPVAPDGTPGFFHPDRFTFGTPLYLSALVAAVMAVPGVQSVTPVVFQRYARVAQGELELGLIRPGDTEVLELRDDPSFPESGRLRIRMGGGR